MAKYLITGVAGFVGRYLVEYILSQDADAKIVGVDIASGCYIDIDYKQLNLCDGETTEKVIANFCPDYIIHLASMSSVAQSWENPQDCFENNNAAIYNILRAVSNNDIKCRILSIGSSEEYGKCDNLPIRENASLNASNPYAIAKISQEVICRFFTIAYGCDVVMTRSFNHIGPRQSERFVIPSFINQLVKISKGYQDKLEVGNIDISRDFLDVRDVVSAYYKILIKGQTGEIYNVCSGQAYQLKDIIQIAEDILEIKCEIVIDKSRIRPNDTMLISGDNSKLKSLGWQQKKNINQTITDMISYYKEKIN